MRTVKQDLDLINRAVEAEGKIGTDGVVTVPNDFFTVLAKLEALQNEVADRAIAERLGYGKSELLRALSAAERS